MIERIENRRGDIDPFGHIDVLSLTEAKESGTIAWGKAPTTADGERVWYAYLGPVKDYGEIPTGCRSGPVINQGKPFGHRSAVVRSVDFFGDETVFISKGGPWGCGFIGVWEERGGGTR